MRPRVASASRSQVSLVRLSLDGEHARLNLDGERIHEVKLVRLRAAPWPSPSPSPSPCAVVLVPATAAKRTMRTHAGRVPRPMGLLPALGTRPTDPFSPFKRARSHPTHSTLALTRWGRRPARRGPRPGRRPGPPVAPKKRRAFFLRATSVPDAFTAPTRSNSRELTQNAQKTQISTRIHDFHPETRRMNRNHSF